MSVTFKGAPVTLGGELPGVGAAAPDFELYDPKLQPVTLATHAGRTRILTINPSVDTGVCAATLRAFHQRAADLGDAIVLAVSADLPFALRRFCAAEGIDRVTAVSSYRDPGFGARYGVLLSSAAGLTGLLARAVIVIDGAGVVRHVELVPEITKEPDYESALRAAR